MPEFHVVPYRGKFAVEWRDETGKRFRQSLRTSVRSEIEPALRRFRQQYEERQKPESITVEYAWTEYKKTLGTRPAGVTMGFEWKAVGPHFGALRADDVSEEDCEAYIAKRRKAGKSDGTIWTELGHLRSALKWADKKGLITKAPAIKRPDRPEPRDKRLTREEAKRFVASCEFPHIKLFAILALTTGARMRALLDLTWNRVDFTRGLIVLHNPDRARTNKTRATVPMNPTARKALLEAREGATGDYVIAWGRGRVGSVKKALQTAGQRAGLPWVTAHVFRHSAATWMAEDGVPMSEIAQFLGHADSRLTERVYARFSPAYLQKAAASLDFGLE